MSRYDASINLISVLDQLRDAYDLAKEAGHAELQERLMTARRQLVQVVHQSLDLHSQLAEVLEQLAQARQSGNTRGSTATTLRAVSDSPPRRVS